MSSAMILFDRRSSPCHSLSYPVRVGLSSDLPWALLPFDCCQLLGSTTLVCFLLLVLPRMMYSSLFGCSLLWTLYSECFGVLYKYKSDFISSYWPAGDRTRDRTSVNVQPSDWYFVVAIFISARHPAVGWSLWRFTWTTLWTRILWYWGMVPWGHNCIESFWNWVCFFFIATHVFCLSISFWWSVLIA